MLNMETAKKIGLNACIDKLGREFVLANKDVATSAYGESDGGVFCFVGVDDRHSRTTCDRSLVLDSHSSFPYRVSCNVSLLDGSPRFVECVTPSH